MSARDVIADWIHFEASIQNGFENSRGRSVNDHAEDILSALRSAGFAPPMHTGAIHRALQDAYAAGGLEMASKADRNYTAQKHKYCDAALNELLKAAQEDSRG